MGDEENEQAAAKVEIFLQTEDDQVAVQIEEVADEEDGEGGEPAAKRPRKPKTFTKELGLWTDESTAIMCGLWQAEELLYNGNHPRHMSKKHRDRSIRTIVDGLAKEGIDMTEDQVVAKQSSLRAYFSGQINKQKREKLKGIDYVSKWRHFRDCYFLEEYIVPRNKDLEGIVIDDVTQVLEESIPLATPKRGAANGKRNSTPGSAKRLPPIQTLSPMKREKTADEAFLEMMQKILTNIPEGEIKDMLKLKIHQECLEAKYKVLNGNV